METAELIISTTQELKRKESVNLLAAMIKKYVTKPEVNEDE